jgi:hypothetical protein
MAEEHAAIERTENPRIARLEAAAVVLRTSAPSPRSCDQASIATSVGLKIEEPAFDRQVAALA